MQANNRDAGSTPGFAVRNKIKNAIDSAMGQKTRVSFLNTKTYALAAVLLVTVGVVSILILLSRNQLTTITAQKGERREVTLEDGSHVFLNANSSVSFSSDFKNHRNLELNGEAFFKVARDEQHPFVVRTGTIKTRVLGTAFNIHQKHKNQVAVSVNTGKVENWSAKVPDYKAVLTKGQQVVFDKSGQQVISTCKSEDLMLWTQNVIVLDNMSLPETARILENWYNVRIDVDMGPSEDLRLSGKFREETLQNVLSSIAILKDLKINYITPKHILIRKKNDNN